MEHTKFCQSCGMPLASREAHGTLASGEKSGDYCAHCCLLYTSSLTGVSPFLCHSCVFFTGGSSP